MNDEQRRKEIEKNINNIENNKNKRTGNRNLPNVQNSIFGSSGFLNNPFQNRIFILFIYLFF
jgi:hypothetical protein